MPTFKVPVLIPQLNSYMFAAYSTIAKASVIVLLLGLAVSAQAQCDCDFTIPAGSGTYTFNGATQGVKPGDVICIAAGARERILFDKVVGSATSYVTIKNCGGKSLIGGPNASNCVIFSNSRYVHVTGTGDPAHQYGISIVGNKTGQGILVSTFSSDFEIDHAEITKVGFAGIMLKTDPSTNCADKKAERPNFTMYNLHLHHNYIHDITGEGIYMGNSFFEGTTVYCGSLQYCHEVRNVRIHHNILENTGWESIQVGSAVQDVEIYNNTVRFYGTANKSSQNGGIQMGKGATGKCYNNFVRGKRGACGTAIVIQGIGDITVFNNVVVDAGSNAINVNTRETPLATDIVPNGFLGPIRIFNNTLVTPQDAAIIDFINETPGNLMYNNLIVGAIAKWDQTKASYDWTKGNNVYIPVLADAKFVNPALDDFRLSAGSPAIDAGRDLASFQVAFDYDNNPRPGGSKWDVGAFEVTGNQKPNVSVGAVPNIILPTNTATITGTATDPDGTIASVVWTKENGPAATLQNQNTLTLTVTGLVEGVYTFRLTATDNLGAVGYKDVVVTVLPLAVNQPPVANATADKTIVLPTSTTTFAGSATDSDGTVTTYAWTQMTGTAVTLANANTPTLTVSGITAAGSYMFRLTVTDDDGATDTDDVILTVQAATVNQNPTANAGADKTLVLPTNSTNVVGSGIDPDGSIASYLWTKQSGPAATMTNQTTSTLSLSGLVQGSYTFRLTVTDDDGATAFDDVVITVSAANQAPVANAGADKTIVLPTSTTTIAGGATDSDGSVTTYLWAQTSGPSSATLSNANTSTLTASGLIQGIYIFRLTVTDDDGATANDEVRITVEAANLPPSANAGSDKTVILPTTNTTLTGTGTDSDGSIASYSWAKISGPTVTLAGQTTNVLTLSNLLEGVYSFRLTVTDNDGATATDNVTLTVLPATVNQSPTADAGPNQTLTLPTNSLNITVTASDPDGTISQYLWEKISGPSVTLSGTSTQTLSLNNLVEGVYVFRITVTDNGSATASDDVTVTVTSVNQNPTVTASADVLLVLPTDATTLTANANDADGTISTFAWSKISGPTFSQSGQNTNTLQLSALLEGTYIFRITVTDNDGGSAFDEVKVVVQAASNVNPVVDAGANTTIYLPTTSATLTGNATDADGTIASYAWTQLSGPAATLSNANTKTLTLTNLTVGVYVLRLTATDNAAGTGFDDVTLTVLNVNQPPIANAGPNITLSLPINSTNLIGSGSDADGSIATYNWFKVSGPSVQMSGGTTAVASLTNLLEGVYVFRLTVTDNNGASSFDEATVTVLPASINQAPVVSAGNNLTITLPTSSTNLTAAASDSDGSISSYSWSKVLGPAAVISGETTASLSITGLQLGTYLFRIVVTDDDGATATDEVTILVQAAGSNQPPVANAGSDKNLFLPSSTINLSGTGSDADGNIVSYLWTKEQGPAATLANANQPTTTVSNLIAGQYTFRLTVTDNNGATAFDEVVVTVFPGTVNQPPVAIAGSNQTIALPNTSATIVGSGFDPDGSIVAYSWTQTSGPSTTLQDTDQPTLNVSGLTLGTFTYQLTVEDDDGSLGSDIVQIVVVSETAKQPPIANAGIDQIITLPQSTTTIQGSGTDLDGTIAGYSWIKKSGPGVVISGNTTSLLSLSSLVEGVYKFTLTVTDNDGLANSDDVTVTVLPATVNANPSVSAGADVFIRLPVNTTTLTATATDADGFIATYNWTKKSGPTFTQSGQTTNALSLSDLVEGTYVFRIQVTDDKGAVGSDEVTVTVLPPGVNTPPVVSAGSSRTISLPIVTTVLNGSASDPGGSIASLLWTQDSGPTSATLINPTTTTLTVDNLAIGTYVFRLSATDNEGASASSTASVLVTDFNLPPVAVAPNDTTLLLPDNVMPLAGSVSDPDGTVADVTWTQVGGEPAELAGEIPTLSAVNLTPGVYTFRLTAIDNLGVEAFDDFVVTVAMGSDPLGASKVFTPNGDAVNNVWIVKNLSLVQNCPVTIFNRLGNVVYSATDYQNDWDGTSLKGQPLQEGDYYFVFKCGGQESFTGALRIIR